MWFLKRRTQSTYENLVIIREDRRFSPNWLEVSPFHKCIKVVKRIKTGSKSQIRPTEDTERCGSDTGSILKRILIFQIRIQNAKRTTMQDFVVQNMSNLKKQLLYTGQSGSFWSMYYKILDKFLSDVSHDPASARIFSILADKDIFILDYRISINKYFGISPNHTANFGYVKIWWGHKSCDLWRTRRISKFINP